LKREAGRIEEVEHRLIGGLGEGEEPRSEGFDRRAALLDRPVLVDGDPQLFRHLLRGLLARLAPPPDQRASLARTGVGGATGLGQQPCRRSLEGDRDSRQQRPPLFGLRPAVLEFPVLLLRDAQCDRDLRRRELSALALLPQDIS
jgi:hypothetical protein